MAEEHDKTHRLIFSFPRMVEDLIRIGLGGDWVKRLDFSTLQKVPERLLSPELLRREEDVLWRLAYSCPEEEEFDWFYVYVQVEHQSRPRRKMSLFTTSYKLMTWQDLFRQGALVTDGKLPPIFSIVFYTGDRAWNEPTSLLDELQSVPGTPEGMDPWSYRLIDARRYSLEKLVGVKSPLIGLLKLAQAKSFEDLAEPSKEISELLGPEDEELRRAFVTMINEEICPRLATEDEEPKRVTDLEEFPTMLEATMDGIIHNLTIEATTQAKAEGKAEGKADLFQELFAARFGEVPGWVRERIAKAKEGQLVSWAKRLLSSERPEDVFD